MADEVDGGLREHSLQTPAPGTDPGMAVAAIADEQRRLRMLFRDAWAWPLTPEKLENYCALNTTQAKRNEASTPLLPLSNDAALGFEVLSLITDDPNPPLYCVHRSWPLVATGVGRMPRLEPLSY